MEKGYWEKKDWRGGSQPPPSEISGLTIIAIFWGTLLIHNGEKVTSLLEPFCERFQEEIQKLTNANIKNVDNYLAVKEQEIMTV